MTQPIESMKVNNKSNFRKEVNALMYTITAADIAAGVGSGEDMLSANPTFDLFTAPNDMYIVQGATHVIEAFDDISGTATLSVGRSNMTSDDDAYINARDIKTTGTTTQITSTSEVINSKNTITGINNKTFSFVKKGTKVIAKLNLASASASTTRKGEVEIVLIVAEKSLSTQLQVE